MASQARILRAAVLAMICCLLVDSGVDAAGKTENGKPERKRTKPARKPKRAPKPKATENTEESGSEAKSGGRKQPKTRTNKSPNVVKAVGTLTATKDAAGKVTEVTFTAEDGKAYSVWLERRAAELGAMHGKTVEVVGLLSEKDGKTVMKIGRWTEVPKTRPSPKVSTGPQIR